MQVIDGHWLRERLSGEHGELKRIADAVGISADKITKILKGERAIRPHEIPKFTAYFQPNNVATGFADEARDFSGSSVTPVTPDRTDHATQITRRDGRVRRIAA